MTQKEKAKRYDELLLKLQKAKVDDNICDEMYYRVIDEIVPELKESEDEKIRKTLIDYFKRYKGQEERGGSTMFCGIPTDDILTWLEKQSEQKPQGKSVLEAINEENADNQFCIKPINKVEPKFHKGDWVVHNDDGCICQITSIREDDYCLWPLDSDIEGYLKITDIDNKYHLWTIQDAKDGDVIATKDAVFIFKHIDKTGLSLCKSHCEVIGNSELGLGFDFSINGVYPATKEQRDKLKKAMADAGYTFDFEKKELKKIKDEIAIAVSNPDTYKIGFADGEAHAKEEQWKPSDAQIEVLKEIIADKYVLDAYKEILKGLQEQLIKLKG